MGKGEREKRIERENEEGTLYVCAFAQCGLQPAAGEASLVFFLIKKTSGLLGFLGYWTRV
jgi:hypothetical protein